MQNQARAERSTNMSTRGHNTASGDKIQSSEGRTGEASLGARTTAHQAPQGSHGEHGSATKGVTYRWGVATDGTVDTIRTHGTMKGTAPAKPSDPRCGMVRANRAQGQGLADQSFLGRDRLRPSACRSQHGNHHIRLDNHNDTQNRRRRPHGRHRGAPAPAAATNTQQANNPTLRRLT